MGATNQFTHRVEVRAVKQMLMGTRATPSEDTAWMVKTEMLADDFGDE